MSGWSNFNRNQGIEDYGHEGSARGMSQLTFLFVVLAMMLGLGGYIVHITSALGALPAKNYDNTLVDSFTYCRAMQDGEAPGTTIKRTYYQLGAPQNYTSHDYYNKKRELSGEIIPNSGQCTQEQVRVTTLLYVS